jgi:molybdenum cofactor biosynthesis enzyme MoaA
MSGGSPASLVSDWRRRKSAAFDLERNSTAGRTIELDLWGRRVEVYANANLSIYSAQRCNAACAFCVEELRPASRGVSLLAQRPDTVDDEAYFRALERVLDATAPLSPSVSVTGGEPSKDPRLPRILRLLAERGARKRTVTTNGSGLLDEREGRAVVDWIASTGVAHLNVSRAHPDQDRNARLMGYRDGPDVEAMREIVRRARARGGGTRVRLSCVLVRGAIDDLPGVLSYLDFARSLGVDNVIFRQLMKVEPSAVLPGPVTRFSDARRAPLEPLLDRISSDGRFELVRQIVGYYYYVEVHRHAGLDVVFEEADLGELEREKARHPGRVHELVFHPHGMLASTWQPWDGLLGPRG